MYYYKYPINYLPNQAGDTTAFAVKQLIQERNYIYQILNNIVAGNTAFMKVGVLVATNDNIALSGEQEIDGVKVADGDRVLVWKQTDATQNGVYTVGAGEWKRAEDADDDADFATGFFIGVTRGEYAGQLFTQYGDVEIDKKPLLFRNIIQGDKVTQEILEAQKKTENASLSAITAADSAKENAEKAKTAKFNAQVIANKVASNVQAVENTREIVANLSDGVRQKADEISELGAKITEKQKALDTTQEQVMNDQRQLGATQAEIVAEQHRTANLLEKAKQAQAEADKNASAAQAAQSGAERAAERAAKSQREAADNEMKSASARSTAEQILTSIGQTRDEINTQLQAASGANLQAKAAVGEAGSIRDEIKRLKAQTEQASTDAAASMGQAKAAADSAQTQGTAATNAAQTAQENAERASTAQKAAEKARESAVAAQTAAQKSADAADKSQAAAKVSEEKAQEYMKSAKEYGTRDLSGYATKGDLKAATDTKMPIDNAYTKKQSDDKFAPKSSLTGLATTDYVDGRFIHIVGNATAALDTLEEIGKSLNNDKDFAGTMTKQLALKADKATTENALLGKADKESVYTKEQADAKYQLKGKYATVKELASKADKTSVYSKSEADEKFAGKSAGYTKSEADAKFQLKDAKVDLSQYYTKEQADGKYQSKGSYATSQTLDERIGGIVDTSGGEFVFKKPISGYLKKSDADAKYQPKGEYALKRDLSEYLTVTQAGAMYAPKESTSQLIDSKANKTDVYTKTECNDVFQGKGDYATRAEVKAAVGEMQAATREELKGLFS